jgi:ribosomal peptide maturation radical SAM protein 1
MAISSQTTPSTSSREVPSLALVAMPFASLHHPSLALGLLKASVHDRPWRVSVHYANLAFAETLGYETYRLFDCFDYIDLVGEWLFTQAAFPGAGAEPPGFLLEAARRLLRRFDSLRGRADTAAAIRRRVLEAREAVSPFLDTLADAILRLRPCLVACTSSYQQHVPSLALLRRIREREPAVITLMGGPNCEADLAIATVRAFPWVDATFSGEAEHAFPELTALFLEYGPEPPADRLPEGAVTRALAAQLAAMPGADRPRAVVPDLDRSPEPDYTDYFDALARSPLRGRFEPALTAESSRGCWYGLREGCTFCGLNGKGRLYRSKSPARFLAHLDRLHRAHGLTQFELSDIALDKSYLTRVLPRLRRRAGRGFRFFCETRADLTRGQVRLMSQTGLRWIQPGIESLHDGLLRLMNKGATAAGNIQLLKYTREFGVRAYWHMLVGFPGDQDAWYAELAERIPLLFHLQPPSGLVPIMLQRFSAYWRHADRYGLALRPLPAYARVYPLPPADLQNLAYFFHDPAQPRPFLETESVGPGLDALRRIVTEWRQAHLRPTPPLLGADDRGGRLDCYDTRPCAPARRVSLTGLEAAACRACEPAAREPDILHRCRRTLGPRHATPEAVARALASLQARKLVLRLNGRYLFLAVPGDIPDIPPSCFQDDQRLIAAFLAADSYRR